MSAPPDPRVEVAKGWLPRFVATGVDVNDCLRLFPKIQRWEEWCARWCELGAAHEKLGDEAAAAGRTVTAAEAYFRAALCYHFGKYLFYHDLPQYRQAHERTLACYTRAMPHLDPPVERVEVPFAGITMPGYLRRPHGTSRPPVAVLIHGLDATKEEMHALSDTFLRRGFATFVFDGPGQGETGFFLKIRPDYEAPLAAALDALQARGDLDTERIGIVGQSLGGYYAPRAAAYEPRVKAAVAICGPYDWGALWPQLPPLTRLAFQHNSGARDEAEAEVKAKALTLAGVAPRIRCLLLVVHAGKDRLIPPSEGERLAREAGGPTKLVIFPEAGHVCHDIPYQYRPLVADWLASALGSEAPAPA